MPCHVLPYGFAVVQRQGKRDEGYRSRLLWTVTLLSSLLSSSCLVSPPTPTPPLSLVLFLSCFVTFTLDPRNLACYTQAVPQFQPIHNGFKIIASPHGGSRYGLGSDNNRRTYSNS